MTGFLRRQLLAGAGLSIAGSIAGGNAGNGTGISPVGSALANDAILPSPDRITRSSAKSTESLRDLAARRGLFYGCAMKSGQITEDPDFTAAVVADCNAIVPEYELKRIITEPSPGRFDFSGADRLSHFAQAHGMLMRGHTLVWHLANPAWLEAALTEEPSMKTHMFDYIETAMGRYGSRVPVWDVVNEAVAPEEGDFLGRRISSPWFKAFGDTYIDDAFHHARAVAPNAILAYNDYGVEMSGSWYGARRRAMLLLLEGLLARNVPIDMVGIQGHLIAFDTAFDEDVFAGFLAEIAGMGLKITITEFDITDRKGPSDPALRDADVAALGRRFLDVALDCKALAGILSWGLSDRYFWVPEDPKQQPPKGQTLRPLPLDDNLAKKPLWDAIAGALRES